MPELPELEALRLQLGPRLEGRLVTAVDVNPKSGHLLRYPPDGGYCPRCGSELLVEPVSVITPPDGGLIATVITRCEACAEH